MGSSKRHIPRKVRKLSSGSAPQTDRYQSLLKEYRSLAKRADQRLVRLERYAQRTGYENIKQYAYARAMRDIRAWGGKTRFNTKPPIDTQQLMAKIHDIEWFLHSASSSLKPTYRNGQLESQGIETVYGKRADSLNKKYAGSGVNVTWENIGQLFESTLYRKLSRKYSSDTAVRIIGAMQKNEDDIVNDFNRAKKDKALNIRIEGEKPLEEKINKTLRYYKKDIKALYDSL